jgi:hypothetical protein
MQAAHGDNGTPGRACCQRLVALVSLTKPGQEPGHVLCGHVADAGPARHTEHGGVAFQVSAIGL